VLGAALLAVTGWLLASAVSGPGQPPVAATHQASPATVNVNAAALLGHPAWAVRERLAALGLHPHVVRSSSSGQPPGTVTSVQPSGRVAEGSIITVTAAVAPPGDRHHQAKDHKKGKGQGGD